MKQSFFISTAISYPNGPPHIGHAYELIAADVVARFMRLDGRDVYFVTGTDDHGQKMDQTARARNMPPQDLADEMTQQFRNMVSCLNCEPDDFIRTSEARHHKAVREIWRKLRDKGDIYKDNYAGWYSVRDEAFYAENELEKNSAGDFISPQGTPVDWVEEESYFFRLSAYQEKLLAYYAANRAFIQPASRYNEVVQFVKSGLKDLSISRTSFKWGVPVPDDDAHVVYVWLDALTNYITTLGFGSDNADLFQKFWPAQYHIIGKDITRFHAIYWPAFLLSAGLELPHHIFAHGFLTVQGEKMSKSLGNVLDPFALATHYGTDALRHFLMRDIPFGRDGSFSDTAMVHRVNADLANDLGNLAKRCLSMIEKNLDGIVPAAPVLTDEDKALLDKAAELSATCRAAMQNLAIHDYLSAVCALVSQANRYFAAQAPWVLKQENPQRMADVLYVAAEIVRQCAIWMQPATPIGAGKILDNLALPADARDFSALGTPLCAGQKLPPPENAFTRLDVSHAED